MERLQTLEELRTRREVEAYFKQLGREITEEELNALKQSYDKAQESNGALTMQQLDDVAGGVGTIHVWDGERCFESTNMIIRRGNGDRLNGYDETTGHQIGWADTKFFKINSHGDPKGQIYSLEEIKTSGIKGYGEIAGDKETMVLIFEPIMDKEGNYERWQSAQFRGGNITAIAVPDEMLEKIHGLPEILSKMQSDGTLSFDSPFILG